MTSDHAIDPDDVDTHSSVIRDCSARLSLKPSNSARGVVDGVWWPRSRDPAIELAALMEELGALRTPVREIGLNRAGWNSAPRRIQLASGRKVTVDWFRSGEVRISRIIDTNFQRIDLLVIPIDTTPAIAELALRMAAEGQDPDIPATGSGDPASSGLPAIAQACPANDDGAADHRAPDPASSNPPSDVAGRQRVVLLPPRSS